MSDSHEKEEAFHSSNSSNSRSATGHISFNAHGRLQSTFTIRGLMYSFSGSFTSSVPPFECHNAILTYSDIRQLTSTRSFDGHIGPMNITLNCRNGPSISGSLDMPMDPGCSISGSGVWTQN